MLEASAFQSDLLKGRKTASRDQCLSNTRSAFAAANIFPAMRLSCYDGSTYPQNPRRVAGMLYGPGGSIE